jgi:uncharacterized protein YecE (DUF72 family)
MPQIYAGTSGYSYADWNGIFYPEDLKKAQQLDFYSQEFNSVEINFTYYAIPDARIFDSMAARVPHDFLFAVKAHRSMTHTRDCPEEDYRSYMEALKPLIGSGRLGPLLLQFPWSFKFSKANMDYLKRLRDNFGSLDLCAEFRHSSWLRHEVMDFLRREGLGFANVDQPQLDTLLPPTSIATTGTGYIRFHGRNKADWWKPREAYMRYDYMYRQEELADWLPRIEKLCSNTRKTHIYFNNHYKAQAVRSARLLQDLLAGDAI